MSPTSAWATALLPMWLPISSSQACNASRSAAANSPRRLSTTARCTRQIPGKIANGWSCAQRMRRLGPLRGAVEVAELLTGADQAAVHLARRVGPEAPLDREEHRLVEVGHPLGDLALIDQDPADGLERLGLEIR